ncbi:MAG: glycosyltransferase family 1 protein, partial [Pseudomonadota bacterium]
MIDIAFYAPLKSPDHPTPSGDREMARNLRSMMTDDGMKARLVSDIRLYDKHGDMGLQTRLQAQAEAE